jgi:hypothetical protein
MPPPQQCLGPDHPAVREPDLRLEIQLEFVLRIGAPQFEIEAPTCLRLGPQHRQEESIGATTGRFCLIQRKVGIGPRRPGDAFDIIRPANHFAEVPGGVVPGDGGGIAEIAADPVRAINAVRDDDQVLINDPNHAATRESHGVQGVLESIKPRSDGKHGAQPAFGVEDRTRERNYPLIARARSNDAAHGLIASCDDLLQIVAVAGKETSGVR